MAVRDRRRRTVEEERSSLRVRGDTLQQRQRVADTIASLSRERGRREQRIDRDNLLQERRDRAKRMPENWCQVHEGFSAFAELEQRTLSLLRVGELCHQEKDLFAILLPIS